MGGTVFNDSHGGPIWASLAEKAFAQLNESGWLPTLARGANSYDALDGNYADGTAGTLFALSGRWANYTLTSVSDIVPAYAAGQLIVFGGSHADLGHPEVVDAHVYALLSYDPQTQMCTLFNPWGMNGGYDADGDFKPGLVTMSRASLAAYFGDEEQTFAAPIRIDGQGLKEDAAEQRTPGGTPWVPPRAEAAPYADATGGRPHDGWRDGWWGGRFGPPV